MYVKDTFASGRIVGIKSGAASLETHLRKMLVLLNHPDAKVFKRKNERLFSSDAPKSLFPAQVSCWSQRNRGSHLC
jgi:hypothetical protein